MKASKCFWVALCLWWEISVQSYGHRRIGGCRAEM